MKTGRKKYFITGGIALAVMVLLGFGLVAARGPGRCFDRGLHRGFHGRNFSEHAFARLDGMIADLSLSDEQNEHFETMKKTIRDGMAEDGKDHEKLFLELRNEFENQDPDIEHAAGLLKNRFQKIPVHMETILDLFVEFYDSLDEAQKDRVLEGLRKKMERHGRS